MSDLEAVPPSKIFYASAELKEILEFNENENKKHREFFQTLSAQTVKALAAIFVVIATVVGFFGWRTISDIRKQAQDATSEEIRSTKEQSQRAMQDEIDRMRKQIAARLDQEFQAPAIRETVKLAARQQTQSAMMPLIQNEVTKQVARGVSARLKTEVEPKIAGLQQQTNLVYLITQAQKGDGGAFDLLSVSKNDQSLPVGERTQARDVYESIVRTRNQHPYAPSPFPNQTPVMQLLKLMNSKDPETRRRAIDSLDPRDKSQFLQSMILSMELESDLDVREAAFRKFNQVTGNHFRIFDIDGAMAWYAKNERK